MIACLSVKYYLFSLKVRLTLGQSQFFSLLNAILNFLDKAIRQENKWHKYKRDKCLYLHVIQVILLKVLEFYRVAGYKISIKKSVALYISNQNGRNAFKRKFQTMCGQNVIEVPSKWRDMLCSWTERVLWKY